MGICDWNTNTEEHSLFRNNRREKGEGDYATYLTQMFRMQQETCTESLNDNTKEKNIGTVGGICCRSRQIKWINLFVSN